jgi:hypothetical protein
MDNEQYYREVLRMQDSFSQLIELEGMICDMVADDVIDVYVDVDGSFHYKIQKEIQQKIEESVKDVKTKMMSFEEMCQDREIDMMYVKMFKNSSNMRFFWR